ncbi:hypothetical protein TGVEG_213460 [Toxoplasma gondii VEG]|uniref:Uncharacterized protein n=1 Tax=Toxoplasma gondii (strain ATCC 50861 / VEG) TaxID=432359 RepID=V4ZEH0_TOXGV|nr:hypothetical protein TGVEG_213460 [Toxoplasma gondii VEG]CEL72816.1 TPA: hypothetical protein BN1205_034850 [Toxoplasma gondii VEG]
MARSFRLCFAAPQSHTRCIRFPPSCSSETGVGVGVGLCVARLCQKVVRIEPVDWSTFDGVGLVHGDWASSASSAGDRRTLTGVPEEEVMYFYTVKCVTLRIGSFSAMSCNTTLLLQFLTVFCPGLRGLLVLCLGYHNMHPAMTPNPSQAAVKLWNVMHDTRHLLAEPLYTLETRFAARHGMRMVLNAVGCSVLPKACHTATSRHPATTNIDTIVALMAELKAPVYTYSSMVSMQRWFEDHPDKREELLIPGGLLEHMLFADADLPLPPIPTTRGGDIRRKRTRFETPVVDFTSMNDVVRPFLPVVHAPSENTIRLYRRSRDGAALLLKQEIHDNFTSCKRGMNFSKWVQQLLQSLVTADFSLAAHMVLDSVILAAEPAESDDGEQQGDVEPSASQSGHSGETVASDDEATPGNSQEDLDGPRASGEGRRKRERFLLEDLEPLCAFVWQRLGVYGDASAEFRTAFLEAAVSIIQDTLRSAKRGVHQQRADLGLRDLEDLFHHALGNVDLLSVLEQVLQRRPELLENFDVDSDLLAAIASRSTEDADTQVISQRREDRSDPSGGGVDQEPTDGAPTPRLQPLIQMLFDAAGGSAIFVGDNAVTFLHELSTSVLPTLLKTARFSWASLSSTMLTMERLEAALRSVAVLRLMSIYVTVLGEKGVLELVPDALKCTCIRNQKRAELAITKLLIVISNAPPAVLGMRQMMDDLIAAAAESRRLPHLEEFAAGEDSGVALTNMVLQDFQTLAQTAINSRTVDRWIEDHPHTQSQLPRSGVLFFYLPRLMPQHEGDDPVVPGAGDAMSPERLAVLFGLGDYTRLSSAIAPYCKESDFPPDDAEARQQWEEALASHLRLASHRAQSDFTRFLLNPLENITTLVQCLMGLEAELARAQYLTDQSPGLLESSRLLGSSFRSASRMSATIWEDIGFFGPLAESAREAVVSFFLQPNDAAVQEALGANAEGTFQERLLLQKRTLGGRSRRLPILAHMNAWLQRNPEILESPYLAADSVLMTAILDASPERRQEYQLGARGRRFDGNDPGSQGPIVHGVKARRHTQKRKWHRHSGKTGSDSPTAGADGTTKRSKAAAQPTDAPQTQPSTDASGLGVESIGAALQAAEGWADDRATLTSPDLAQPPVEVPESEQTEDEPGTSELIDPVDGKMLSDLSEAERPIHQDAESAIIAAARALVSLHSLGDGLVGIEEVDGVSLPQADQVEHHTAREQRTEKLELPEFASGDGYVGRIPEEQAFVSAGDGRSDFSTTADSVVQHDPSTSGFGEGPGDSATDEGDVPNADVPLDMSAKSGIMGSFPGTSGTPTGPPYLGEDYEDDDYMSEEDGPLDLSVKPADAFSSGAPIDGGAVGSDSEDDGDLSPEDVPLDLSAKTGIMGSFPGTSGTPTGPPYLGEDYEDDDYMSEEDGPLDLSVKPADAFSSGAPIDGGAVGSDSEDDGDLSPEDVPLDLSAKTGIMGSFPGTSGTPTGPPYLGEDYEDDDYMSEEDGPLDLSVKPADAFSSGAPIDGGAVGSKSEEGEGLPDEDEPLDLSPKTGGKPSGT